MLIKCKPVAAAALLAGLLALGPAAAIEPARAPGGEPYLMGGIGQDEVAALHLAQGQFNLSLRTAAKTSGAYIADAHLRITSAQGRIVLDQDLQGPLLLISLAPGRYTLQASWVGQVERRSVTIPVRGWREAVFYFASAQD